MSKKTQFIVAMITAVVLLAGYAAYHSMKNGPDIQQGQQTNQVVQQQTTTVASSTMDDQKMDTSPEQSNPSSNGQENVNQYEGVHIMPDGTVMKKNGDKIIDATILANGTIQMSDGTIVTPAIDMREKTETTSTVNGSQHLVFDVEGKDYEYNLNQIKVKKGDTVTINFKSTQGFHDWVVDELGVATKRVNTGEATSVTFTADTVGTFQYYCSVMNHRQKGMVGYIVIQ